MARVALVILLICALGGSGVHAASERVQSTLPVDLTDAWEKLQRAWQDWTGQLRDRLGGRDSREDRPVITLILNYRDFLKLSSEQVRKLEQLRDDFQRQTIRHDADVRILELDIAGMIDQPNVDVAKVEAKIREVEKLRADLRVARIRTIEQAKAVLNAEQRKKFYESIDERQARPPRSGRNPGAKE